jgi:hypothetical protein
MALSRASSPNGFSMKSTTPSFMASMASGTSAWPVITTTGRAEPAAFTRRTSSRPLISGIRTSVRMQPGSAWARPSRKLTAES